MAANPAKMCKCFIKTQVREGEVREGEVREGYGFSLPISCLSLTVIWEVPQSYYLSIDILICTDNGLIGLQASTR
jgi:hypothetical protein